MKNKVSLILLLWGFIVSVFSQTQNIQLSIVPSFGTQTLHLADSAFYSNDSNALQIHLLKFYISHIQLLKNGHVVLEEKNSFHLLDANQVQSCRIDIENPHNIVFDELKFNLGIDSETNVSGAMGGDLDPTKGMYWTWQSGYINFKLEGSSKLCHTKNNEFQFHLGGYQQPYDCLQTLSFPILNSENIILKLDIQSILNQMDLMHTHHIMSPGIEAAMLSKIIASSFTISDH